MILGIAVLVGGLVALGVARSREVPDLAEQDPPVSYRISYRVDERGTTSVQLLTVRRPFDGRNQTSAPDGSSVAGLVSTAERAWRLEGESVHDLGPKAPSTPPGDSRPLQAMGRAIAAGLAKHAGNARVLGRRCTKFAVAEPLGKPLGPPGPISRTELCVDQRGLVLEERWTSGGKLVRLRRALEVDTSPELSDEIFLIGAAQGLPALTPSPGPSPPGGFVRLPQAWSIADPPTYVEAWVRGPDLILLERVEAERPPWARNPHGISEDGGELVLDLVASQFRFSAGGTTHVRLSGTVTPETLRTAARRIR